MTYYYWNEAYGFYPTVPPPLPTASEMCRYCADAYEPPAVYFSHSMYSRSTGVAECPRFRREGCPRCHARGDRAHELSKCRRPPKSPKQYICLMQTQERKPTRLVVLKKIKRRCPGTAQAPPTQSRQSAQAQPTGPTEPTSSDQPTQSNLPT